MREFIIEVLGIDGRGLRLLRDVFVRPRRVFADFLDGTVHAYAPPLRVWLWVYGLHVVVLLTIGGAGGLFDRIDAAQEGTSFYELLERSGVQQARFAEVAGNWWTFLNPLIALIYSIPAAAILGAFRRGTNLTEQANIYLACFLAASTVALVARPLFIELNPAYAGLTGLLQAAIFALTFARGASGNGYFGSWFGGVIKTILLGGVFLLTTLASAITLIVGIAMFVRATG